MDWQPASYVTTMSLPAGAGFYSDAFGPLPYAFRRPPAERYVIMVLGAPDSSPSHEGAP
jgi:hypothetical protein